MKELGFKLVDGPLTPPGGALALVCEELDQHNYNAWAMGVYAGLHNPGVLGVEVHYDCGAVKKLLGKKFDTEAEEREFLLAHLRKAAEKVKRENPACSVVGILSKPEGDAKATFEKIFEI